MAAPPPQVLAYYATGEEDQRRAGHLLTVARR